MDLLVSMEQFKQSIRVTHESEDDDLQVRLEVAQEAVLDYLAQRRSDGDTWAETIAAWDEETVPRRVKAAILDLAGDLWAARGNEPGRGSSGTTPSQGKGHLPDRVRMLLDRLRDPAIA